MNQKAITIKRYVKEKLNIAPSKYSLRWSPCTYSRSLQANVKDPTIGLSKLSEFLKREFESVRHCEYTGEILSGGNVYVSVSYAWDMFTKEKRKEVEKTCQDLLCEYMRSDRNNWGTSCWNPFMSEDNWNDFLDYASNKTGFHKDYVAYTTGRPHRCDLIVKENLKNS
jgi:hypothetical protein